MYHQQFLEELKKTDTSLIAEVNQHVRKLYLNKPIVDVQYGFSRRYRTVPGELGRDTKNADKKHFRAISR